MNREINLLFTSVGRRVELVEAFRKAAAQTNIKLVIYGVDISFNAPALYYCDKKIQICRIYDKQYIPELLSMCREYAIDAIIPTIDTDLLLLSEHKKEFEKLGTKVYISEIDKIKICRDKHNTGDFFQKCGLRAPKAYRDIADYPNLYPAFIKPSDGSSSINAYKVDNRDDLQQYASHIRDYIVQPYIRGKEYTIDIFCNYDGTPVYITPRERIAVRSGEVLQTRIIQDENMIAEMKKLIREFHPCGQITVQMIRENVTNIDYYIEINPRFGGGAPLSIKAGADSSKALLMDVAGNSMGYEEYAAMDGAIYSRFDQSICIEAGKKKCVK